MSVIDIHFHGTEHIDINEVKSLEQLLFLSEEYGKKGVDSFLITLYPESVYKMREKLSFIKKAILENKLRANILGAYLEGPFLNPKHSGALDKRYLLMPNNEDFKRIVDGFEDIIKVMTVAPELPGALELIERAVEKGIRIGMGHSDATFKEAEEGFRAGAKLITHIFNAMRGIHHREPGLAGFGLINEEVFIEVIGDGRHLSDDVLKWIFKIKNPERIILVSDMVKESGNEERLRGGNLSLFEIKERLIKIGFSIEIINKAVYENPLNFLKT
ncbi:hypothetical protein [Thermodesulfovibrio sp.]|uniref:hypothetical protein n=1 Tax=Thermodesulfovibrio TaxID=28261 RepID=UPI002614150E|nr:hypothetical protein [Thermodesulfovibrio sp.]